MSIRDRRTFFSERRGNGFKDIPVYLDNNVNYCVSLQLKLLLRVISLRLTLLRIDLSSVDTLCLLSRTLASDPSDEARYGASDDAGTYGERSGDHVRGYVGTCHSAEATLGDSGSQRIRAVEIASGRVPLHQRPAYGALWALGPFSAGPMLGDRWRFKRISAVAVSIVAAASHIYLAGWASKDL